MHVIVTRIFLLLGAAVCFVFLRWPERVVRVSYWWRVNPPVLPVESMRTMRVLCVFVAVVLIAGFLVSLKYPSLFE
jgi:hypothetical protein